MPANFQRNRMLSMTKTTCVQNVAWLAKSPQDETEQTQGCAIHKETLATVSRTAETLRQRGRLRRMPKEQPELSVCWNPRRRHVRFAKSSSCHVVAWLPRSKAICANLIHSKAEPFKVLSPSFSAPTIMLQIARFRNVTASVWRKRRQHAISE